MSALFARGALNSKNEVKIHGVARSEGKGIPRCIKQTEMSNEKVAASMRNTIKVAKIEGDSKIDDLLFHI